MKEIRFTRKESNYLLWALQLLVNYLFKQRNSKHGSERKKLDKKMDEIHILKKKFI